MNNREKPGAANNLTSLNQWHEDTLGGSDKYGRRGQAKTGAKIEKPSCKQSIVVFYIPGRGEKPFVIAKQTSDVDIICMKFSPVDSKVLVSSGRENVRFWNIKDQPHCEKTVGEVLAQKRTHKFSYDKKNA